MNKLIIIFRNHFTKKEFEKLNIDSYIKKNIIIEVWVMNKLLKDKVIFSSMKNKKKFKIKNIKNINDLEKKIISQQKDNIIYQVHLKFELKNIDIFKLITKYNCTYLISPGLSINNKKKISTKISKLLSFDSIYLSKVIFNKINNIINRIIFKIKINLFDFKKADFFYCKAKRYFEDNKNDFLISKKTKIIWGHQKDYEFFFKNRKIIKKNKDLKKKILFIDQNVPYHSDLITMNVADINPKNYYNSINNFLKKLSDNLKIDVHICCHPRSNLKIIKKFFPKISLSIGDTEKQIKNAKCLIVHDSTAINFGVLYLKPIIFIYNEALNQSNWAHVSGIKNVALRLRKKFYNIDTNEKLIFKNFNEEIKVNNHNYWIYKKNYIKYKGTNKNSAEEIIDKLKLNKIWN